MTGWMELGRLQIPSTICFKRVKDSLRMRSSGSGFM